MRTFGRLLGFLRPYRRGVVWSFVLAALAMVATVAIPLLTGRAVDAIRSHDHGALRDVLVNRARTFVFTTAPPPPVAAAAQAGIELASGPEGDSRRARLGRNGAFLASRLEGRLTAPPGPWLCTSPGTGTPTAPCN